MQYGFTQPLSFCCTHAESETALLRSSIKASKLPFPAAELLEKAIPSCSSPSRKTSQQYKVPLHIGAKSWKKSTVYKPPPRLSKSYGRERERDSRKSRLQLLSFSAIFAGAAAPVSQRVLMKNSLSLSREISGRAREQYKGARSRERPQVPRKLF